MADFNKPVVSDPYSDVLQAVRDLLAECAKFQDGSTNTNVPTGAVRFSSTSKRFEKWNGTAWVELIAKASDKYDLNVDRVDGYDAGNASGNIAVNNGTVNTNLNADLLDGQHGSYYSTASATATAQSTADAAAAAAASANTNANGRVAKSGDTMTGQLGLPGGGTGSQAATVAQAQALANTAEANAIAVANTKATPASVALKLDKAGDTAAEIYNTGWYRSIGAAGWYNQTHGGGLWMNDANWVRIYGGKGLTTDWHQMPSGGNIWTSSYGWLHDKFALAGDFHHIVSVIENCANQFGGTLSAAKSGNTLQLKLVGAACHCDCNNY